MEAEKAGLVLTVIKSRVSVRSYSKEPIPDELVREILECAIAAPSAGNLQPWRFIVVKDPDKKEKLAKAAFGQMFIAEAPIVIVVCAIPEESSLYYGERGEKLYCIQDTAAAIENILIAVHALGLGACWIGAFDEDEVRKILGIPDYARPVALIPIGKPAFKPKKPPRRPLEEVVFEDEWGRRPQWLQKS